MLGGLNELVWRGRALGVFALPLIVGTMLSIALALGSSPVPAAAPRPRHAPPPAALVASHAPDHRISPRYLRSLPRDVPATVGKAKFEKAPPPASHTTLLPSGAVPSAAIDAYEKAAATLWKSDPRCHLGWADLAGIGKVESDNGLTWGTAARISSNGTLTPPILGPLLNGSDGLPAIPTPDHGVLEQGGKWERAVGPMQFLPSTWLAYAQDGNGDGVKNPQNIWDAALTTGTYLCANGGDLATKGGFDAAVLAYNHSEAYLSAVASWVRYYGAVGPKRLLADGGSLLKGGVSTLHPGGGSSTRAHPTGTTAPPAPDVAQLVRQGVAGTSASGSYLVAFRLARGSTSSGASLASGSAEVNVRTGAAEITADVPVFGRIAIVVLRTPAASTDVQLPAQLASSLGEPNDDFLAWTSALQGALPAAVVAGVDFAADDVRVLLTQLDGISSGGAVVGHTTIGGDPVTEYHGETLLSAAASAVPSAATALGDVSRLSGAGPLAFGADIDSTGVIRQLQITLPHMGAAYSTPITLVAELFEFGTAVHVASPTLGSYPPKSGTTSTSTTTTTRPGTTSTSTTTSTTTLPVSFTTTTTTTRPPPTTNGTESP